MRAIYGTIRQAALVLAALFCLAGAVSAQNAAAEPLIVELSPGQDAASIEAAIRAATATGRPLTVRWATAGTLQSPASTVPSTPSGPAQQADADLLETLSTGIGLGVAGLQALPSALGMSAERLGVSTRDADVSIGGVIVLTLIAALLALLLRGMLPTARTLDGSADLRARARSASRSALAHLLALGIFIILAFAAHRSLLSFHTPGAAASSAVLRVLAVTGIYLVAADWLLAPRRPERRLLRVAHPRWHFGMLVSYGAIGAAVAGLMTLLQEANAGIEPLRGLALLGMSVLTIMKLVWFVLGRHDITAAFAGPAPGLVRRGAAQAYPWLLVALAMLLWVMECLSLNQTGPSDWYATARWTQILAFLIPLAAMGLHALSGAMLKRHEADGRPVVTAAFMAGRALATGAVWVGGLLVVTHLWSKALVGTDADGLAVGLDHALRLGLGVVAGWTLWTFAAAFFRIHLPPGGPAAFATGEETAQTAPATRLSTVLPLIRDVALGLVIAVTALLVLSALGLNIAPLLAGFGVFGLAISFGSQTLVRDIVSGIFFIADDAFRVGEYIDTGKLKGTVEKISLRSARLRHQNGQFHTMPFGQMQSITNYSRDWSVVKFELRFDLGVDVEKLRKTVKRVGLEMMEDPELAAQILQPLKMQGIQDVTETALVVRLKFTGRPGNPSLVQRDAMRRLLAAFRADNIDLAFNPANRSAPVLGAPYAAALIPETAVPAHAPG